tara:strand:- start:1799 stop:2686 length:888 start_codon:yes stop_codon:yes gene_type:complete
MANIKDTLKESTKDLLSEEALNEIESAFNEAVDAKAGLQVEAALVQQDDDHAKKVQTLLEAIDTDHTKKLENIVGAVNENHTAKLQAVIKKYQSVINEEAGDFKTSLVGTISNYLEVYLEQTFPTDMLGEAVNNKRSDAVLDEVRKLLGVDLALAKDTIRDAIADGKKQIVESTSMSDQLTKENEALKIELAHIEAEKTLTDLSKDLPSEKQAYVARVLSNKTAEFIKENFDYTVKLFDKEQDNELEQITEEATKQVATGDVETMIESVDVEYENPTEQEDTSWQRNYMGELGKY